MTPTPRTAARSRPAPRKPQARRTPTARKPDARPTTAATATRATKTVAKSAKAASARRAKPRKQPLVSRRDVEPLNLPGMLVCVEGVDGSGKSTQIRLLHAWLQGLGCKVFFSEWNSSDLVKGATKRGKKDQLLSPTTFSLIHATDFADRYERQILPRLEAGFLVLCDRYMFTAFARDRVRGCDPAWLRQMYSFAHVPDITFYFDVPLQVSLDRILGGRPKLKYHEAGMDLDLHTDIRESFKIFQGRIVQEYLAMVREDGFTVMDGTKDIHSTQRRMRELVQQRIDLSKFQRRSRIFRGGDE